MDQNLMCFLSILCICATIIILRWLRPEPDTDVLKMLFKEGWELGFNAAMKKMKETDGEGKGDELR